jgi:ATP-dependent DNA helicase RecG
MNKQQNSLTSVSSKSKSPSLQYIKGVGPKRAAALESIGIHSIYDLLYYFPRDYLDRSSIVKSSDLSPYLQSKQQVTVIGEVFRKEARRSRRTNRLVLFITLRDDSGYLSCVWFEGIKWHRDAFEVGELLAVSAVPTPDHLGRPQFVHPEYDRLRGALEEDEPDWGKLFNTGAIIPKYSSSQELTSAGLDSRGFRRILRQAVNRHLDELEETLPDELRARNNLLDIRKAISNIHFPASTKDLHDARRRLKFDELFYLQVMLAVRRRTLKEGEPGISFQIESKLARQLVDSLPFQLTNAQRKVIREIADDMKSPRVMNRLLQGDVGSGKTIVALTAMLIAVENGYQAVFMAPTEILAEQHHRTLSSFLQGLPVNIRLLIGGQRKKLRRDILEDVQRGSANIVVGTHALLEETVEFSKLGLVVIDEQHRFGVLQRAELRQKGSNPDVMVMTATPIPRSLALTLYGDLDVSVLDEMPADRRPVKTAVRTEDQKQKVFDFVKEEVRRGRQAYIVFPLIEESEKIDLKAATVEFERLQRDVFPDSKLGLLHGRMKTEEKDETMSAFQRGEFQILVATTVIEVGIDIPNATVMIIVNAERFGLSQLHQLRGRVGRGADQSYCILLADYAWFDRGRKRPTRQPSAGKGSASIQDEKQLARVRLETMVGTTDGFKIAEVDLELRGPGEFFGTRQSGIPEFKIANIVRDGELLTLARREAFRLIKEDPELRRAANEPVRRTIERTYKDIIGLASVG